VFFETSSSAEGHADAEINRVVGLRMTAGRVRSLWFGRLPDGMLEAAGYPAVGSTRAAL